jgi:hypothetical protein
MFVMGISFQAKSRSVNMKARAASGDAVRHGSSGVGAGARWRMIVIGALAAGRAGSSG